MATTVNELPAGSGSKIVPTPGSISLSRASTRLYCSVQNAAASSLPPVHSDCSAIRDVRRSTLINLTSSFSRSIFTLQILSHRLCVLCVSAVIRVAHLFTAESAEIAQRKLFACHRHRHTPDSPASWATTKIKTTTKSSNKLRLISFEVSE